MGISTTTMIPPRRVLNQVGRTDTLDELECCCSVNTRLRNTHAQSRARELLTKKPGKKPSKSTHAENEMNSTLNRTLLPDYDGVVYTLDAKLIGNIGRYFNHSCSPNIAVQNVFVDVSDERLFGSPIDDCSVLVRRRTIFTFPGSASSPRKPSGRAQNSGEHLPSRLVCIRSLVV